MLQPNYSTEPAKLRPYPSLPGIPRSKTGFLAHLNFLVFCKIYTPSEVEVLLTSLAPAEKQKQNGRYCTHKFYDHTAVQSFAFNRAAHYRRFLFPNTIFACSCLDASIFLLPTLNLKPTQLSLECQANFYN